MIYDLFSKRQKRARGEIPDVYDYDKLPQPLRVQIIHIIKDALHGNVFTGINRILCKEYGVFELIYKPDSDQEAVFKFFLDEKSIERALDVVELCFRLIQKISNGDEAIAELNKRFKEHGVGYQFESGQIIRVDSQFLHTEAIKPTLVILHDKRFEGANEEFLKAHEHYRHWRYKECLVEALKAFESTMKIICDLRGWPIQPTDTAKKLIAICIKNGLFPEHFTRQFTSITDLLESGIPTIRNKTSGHGQGTELVEVPEYLARYALNLTATTILFITEAHQATSS